MTSNIGARNIIAPKRLGFTSTADAKADYTAMKKNVMDEVKRLFRPELLNRIDEMIVFHPLNQDHIKQIVSLMIRQLASRIEKNMGIVIEISDRAKEYLAKEGFDQAYGARPLRRAIQSKVEDRLAENILDGQIKEGDHVNIDLENEELAFQVK
jgi:ATP-dependent Clp protease ATP-binding subunit ClpC